MAVKLHIVEYNLKVIQQVSSNVLKKEAVCSCTHLTRPHGAGLLQLLQNRIFLPV